MTSRRTAIAGRFSLFARRASATLVLACAPWLPAAYAGATEPTASESASPSAVVIEDHSQRARVLTERGIRYEHAEGEQRNLAVAHDLYCAAARSEYADGLIRLGWMYANGRGVPRDDSYANTLFRRAGALGSDLGARLADAIRGGEDKLPACMTPPALLADEGSEGAAKSAQADAGPTPTVEAPAQFRPAPSSAEYRRLVGTVVRMAREFRLDPRLVFALIRVESNFDPQARSPKNAQGLMQLIPETAERFAVKDVWDPVENLRGGMTYLRWLLSYFKGDVVLTLAAYNAGEGMVDRYRGVPPFGETVAYVQRIRAIYPLDRHAFDPKIAILNPPIGQRRLAQAQGR